MVCFVQASLARRKRYRLPGFDAFERGGRQVHGSAGVGEGDGGFGVGVDGAQFAVVSVPPSLVYERINQEAPRYNIFA